MADAQLLLCLIKHATEAGIATQQKLTCVRKELKTRKDMLSSSTSASDLVGKLGQRKDETEVLAYHFL